jgi:hypothetical protein
MAARTAAPWSGADSIPERQSRFNRQDSHGPTRPGQKPGLFFFPRSRAVAVLPMRRRGLVIEVRRECGLHRARVKNSKLLPSVRIEHVALRYRTRHHIRITRATGHLGGHLVGQPSLPLVPVGGAVGQMRQHCRQKVDSARRMDGVRTPSGTGSGPSMGAWSWRR